jgi:hypothetical protein
VRLSVGMGFLICYMAENLPVGGGGSGQYHTPPTHVARGSYAIIYCRSC